jgi:hypothetical protein
MATEKKMWSATLLQVVAVLSAVGGAISLIGAISSYNDRQTTEVFGQTVELSGGNEATLAAGITIFFSSLVVAAALWAFAQLVQDMHDLRNHVIQHDASLVEGGSPPLEGAGSVAQAARTLETRPDVPSVPGMTVAAYSSRWAFGRRPNEAGSSIVDLDTGVREDFPTDESGWATFLERTDRTFHSVQAVGPAD